VTMKAWFAVLPLFLSLAAAPARAGEIFGGVYAHDVDTPLDLRGYGEGTDFQLGWRGERMRSLSAIGSPSPYVFGALNTSGDAHYAAAGISWRIGRTVYFRPGIGIAVHSGPLRSTDPAEPGRGLGSRILFEPEAGLGVVVSDRMSVEASWIHMSHATLLADQNPGMDNIGVRLNYRF
jgi:lipid A 3-O-deacylase